jgi:tripartite-type tricarboxylate transporter receptor subunit TctC
MKLWAKCITAALFPFMLAPTYASDFLEGKPLNIVIGFAPGGAADAMARIVAKKVSENLGQSVVVVNRPGAGGNIAQQSVVSAAPDGTTILLGSIGSLTINPHLMPFSYDPLKDLAPITMGATYPLVLIAPASLGAKNLNDFINIAKSKKLDYASSGVGSATHLAGELFNQRAGLDMVHIAYKGGGPAMVDLVSGHTSAYYASPTSAAPFIQDGRVVALGTTGLTRPEVLSNVPTIAESGFPGFNAINWYAYLAPAKTPKPILDRWNAALVEALNAPDVKDLLEKQGLSPMPGTPQELLSFMESESKSWKDVIKERNITLQ